MISVNDGTDCPFQTTGTHGSEQLQKPYISQTSWVCLTFVIISHHSSAPLFVCRGPNGVSLWTGLHAYWPRGKLARRCKFAPIFNKKQLVLRCGGVRDAGEMVSWKFLSSALPSRSTRTTNWIPMPTQTTTFPEQASACCTQLPSMQFNFQSFTPSAAIHDRM